MFSQSMIQISKERAVKKRGIQNNNLKNIIPCIFTINIATSMLQISTNLADTFKSACSLFLFNIYIFFYEDLEGYLK